MLLMTASISRCQLFMQLYTIMHLLTFMFTFLPLRDEFQLKYPLILNTKKSESTGTFLYYDK